MRVTLEEIDKLRMHIGEETVADRQARELMEMTGEDSETIQDAISRQHTDFLRNLSLTFTIEMISEHTIDAFRRHYRVPCVVQRNDPSSPMIRPDSISNSPVSELYQEIANTMRKFCEQMKAVGIPARDASYILPGAMTCTAKISMNMADLLEFFSVECCDRSHWETRELADKMLDLCKIVAPSVFETAGPPCVRYSCQKECEHCRRTEWGQF